MTETEMCHVLIIEDDWLIADYVEHVARGAGATSVELADSEYDAVEAAQRRRPEIILSDVKLRAGTGPCAVKTIMAVCGPIPVIFITATPGECIPCDPPVEILTKPVQAAALAEAFRRLAPVN